MKAIIRFLICLWLLTISFGAPKALAVNKVLYLDGSGDYVEIPAPPQWNGNTSFTVSFWMIYSPMPYRIWIMDIGTRNNRSYRNVHWLINPDGNTQFGFWDGAQNQFDISSYQGSWVFVTTVYEASNESLKTYLNGILIDSDSVPKTPDLEPDKIEIGLEALYESYFNGLIDEVRIWNIARTQEEIQATMNTTLKGNEPGLVGYWNFDDGTANDSSPYGNHGTLEGNAKIIPHRNSLPPLYLPPLYQRVVALNNAVSLSWRAIIDLTGQFDHYAIYRATRPFSSVVGMTPIGKVADINVTNYLDNTAINGEKYYYAVTVVSKGGDEMTDVVSISPLTPRDDLTIGWIARFPKMDYVWGSANPKVYGWPAVGQQVTWRAYVKNWSRFDRQGISYKWYLDGTQVSSGTVDIPAQTTVTIDFPWTWTFNRHELQLIIDPDNLVPEEEEENNSLSIYTDAISVGFYVEQSVYDYFSENQYKLGVHSNCWEDWAQRQVRRWNEMFKNAIYPEAPNGVLDRIRIDEIVIVPDGALPLVGSGPSGNFPNLNDRTVDLLWGFSVTVLNGDFYKNHTKVSDDNAFYYERSLIHELSHARYLDDTYGFNVHDNGSGNTVAIQENGKLIVGTDYMPFIAWDAVYYTAENGLTGWGATLPGRYDTMALNLIAGHRATLGNYNCPGNCGIFLNRDLPAENRLTVKDASDHVLANANIKIYIV